tara:strand:+ start:119 stop:1459 length:1341 start_codon:yes stop_codon:yes gene_type:complete
MNLKKLSELVKKQCSINKQYTILTEESPQECVIKYIFKRIGIHKSRYEEIEIIPIYDDEGKFLFRYTVEGFENILIKMVSGTSSFVDYLVFKGIESHDNVPRYAIEATKTDDGKSRNTAAYQRLIKFAHLEHYYEDVRKVMFFEYDYDSSKKITNTMKFAIKLMKTLNIKIIDKNGNKMFCDFKKFKNLDEMAKEKNNIALNSRKGNVALTIIINDKNEIELTGKLEKSGKFDHDPNKGYFAAVIRIIRDVFNDDRKIIIRLHQLKQKMIRMNNKFFYNIDDNVSLRGIKLDFSKIQLPEYYWKYASITQEKRATILQEKYLTNTGHKVLFSNHGGCARTYLYGLDDDEVIELPKTGFTIPDLVLYKNDVIYLIEGKVEGKEEKGREQLENLDLFINKVKEHDSLKDCVFKKGLCLMCITSINDILKEEDILFLLDKNGNIYNKIL